MGVNIETLKTTFCTKDIDSDLPVFPISTIANIIGVHQMTLRIYDEQGILVPKRNSKNRRMYSYSDIKRGFFIQFMTKKLGINLVGIKTIFKLLKKAKVNEADYEAHIEQIAKNLKIIKNMKLDNN